MVLLVGSFGENSNDNLEKFRDLNGIVIFSYFHQVNIFGFDSLFDFRIKVLLYCIDYFLEVIELKGPFIRIFYQLIQAHFEMNSLP